jgi:hypothetical protein
VSLIYDALKRAEDDNKRIGTGVRTASRQTLLGKRRRQWIWALVGVLAVNAIVVTTLVVALGYRWSGSRPAETEPRVAATPAPRPAVVTPQPEAASQPAVATAPPQTAPQPAVSPPPQPAPPRAMPVEPAPAARLAPPPTVTPHRATPVESAPVAKAVKPPAPAVESPRVAAAPPPTPAAPAAPVPPASRVAPSGPVVTATPAAPAAPIAPTSPVAPAPRVTPPAAESPRVVIRPREEPPAARVERQVPPAAVARRSDARPEPEPLRRPAITGETASVDEKAGGRTAPPPAIALQVLVYSDVPAERMVFIDGRRLIEGDSIDAETTLERINKDGIVIRRRGVRYVILSQRD